MWLSDCRKAQEMNVLSGCAKRKTTTAWWGGKRERRLNLTHQLLPSQIKIIQQDSFLSVSRPKHLGFHYTVNICVYGAHKCWMSQETHISCYLHQKLTNFTLPLFPEKFSVLSLL